MPSPLARLNPLRNAFLAAAVFLSVIVLLTLFAPVPVASAASFMLLPGGWLVRFARLPAGFITVVVAFYVNFAVYTLLFALVLRLAIARKS